MPPYPEYSWSNQAGAHKLLQSIKKLLDPKTIAVDSTLLEADAAMKSIVRRDTGAGYKDYVKRLAAEAGV